MAEEDSEFELEGFKKHLGSLFDSFLREELGPESQTYCARFCKLVEEYTGRWQGPVPKLRVLQSALCSFLPASACFPKDCEHVQCTLSSLALSVFELLLFFSQSDLLTNPLRDILDSLQECCSPLTRFQNVHLLQVRQVIGEGGPWASAVLHAILTEAELPRDEVDRYLGSEMPVFMELRVRYLMANQRVSEATALAAACSQHPAAGRHPFFLQVYLTCLLKASHHDTMHQVIGEADAKDAVDVICYMEREEEDDGLVLTLCRAFLSQQLHRGDMYCMWDLVFIWSKLQLRVNPSKQALLDQCHQLMLSATNVKSIFPFMRVILAELGKEALRFCVELCTHALQSDLSCDPSTKSLIYKTIAYLLPSDLEVCRACALLVFFLERSLEAYKTVFLLYTHPDQEYLAEASPVGNHVRFEVLQVLKRGLYFDPEFWNLMALRTNCLKLMSEKVVSAALVENLEEQMWLPSYCSTKEPAVCCGTWDGDLTASRLPAKPRTNHQTPVPKKRLHKDDKNHHANPPAAKRVKTRLEKTESTGLSSVNLATKKRGKKPGSPPSARDVGRGGGGGTSLRRSFRQLDSASQENLARQVGDRPHHHMTRLSEQKPPKRKIRKPRWLLEEELATLAENSAPRKGKKRGRKPQQQRQQLRATGATRRSAAPGVVRNTSKQKTAGSHSPRIAAGKEIQNNKRRKEFSTKNSLVEAPASFSPDLALEVSQPDNELGVCFTEDLAVKQENLPQMSPPHPAFCEYSPVFIVRPQQTTYQPHNEVIIRARDPCNFILKLHSYARRSKVKCGLPVIMDKQASDRTMTVTPLYQRRPDCPSVEPEEKPVEFASLTQATAGVEIPSERQEGAVATMFLPRDEESTSGGHGRLNDSSYLFTSENSIVHNTVCATKETVHKESLYSKHTKALKETLATDITSVSNVTAYIEVEDVPKEPAASEVTDKTAKQTGMTENTVVQDQPTDKDITNVLKLSLPSGNSTAPKEPTDAGDHTSPRESTATDDPDTPSLGLRIDLAKDISRQAMATDTDAHKEPMMGEIDTGIVTDNKTPLLDRSASVLPIEMPTDSDNGLAVEQNYPLVAGAQSEPEAEVTTGSGPQPDSEPSTGSGPQLDSEPTKGFGPQPDSEPSTDSGPQTDSEPSTGSGPQQVSEPQPQGSELEEQTTGAGPQGSELEEQTTGAGPQGSELEEQTTGAGPQGSELEEQTTGAGPQAESEPTTGSGPQLVSESTTGSVPQPESESTTGAGPQPESRPTTGAGPPPETEPTTGSGPQPESEPTTGAGLPPETEPTTGAGPQPESGPTTGAGPQPESGPTTGSVPQPESESTTGAGLPPESGPTTGAGPQPESGPTTGSVPQPESESTTGAGPQPESGPTTGAGPQTASKEQTPYAGPQPESKEQTTCAGPQPESKEVTTCAGPQTASKEQTPYAGPQPESKEQTTCAGPQTASKEVTTCAGPQTASKEQTPYAGPQPESKEQTTCAGPQTASKEVTTCAGPQIASKEQTPYAGPQPESKEQTTCPGPQPESELTLMSGPHLESEPTTGSGPQDTAEEETPAALDQPSVCSSHDPEDSLLTHRCTMCNKVFKGQRVVAHAMDHYRRDQCMFCGVLFTDNILAMVHLSEHIDILKKKGNVVPVEDTFKKGKVMVEDEVQGNGTPETPEPQSPTQSGSRRGKRKRSATDSSGSTATDSRRLRSSLKLEDTQSKELIGQMVAKPCNDKQTVLRVNGHFRGRRTSIKEGEEQESIRLEETLSPEMRDEVKGFSTPVRATRELRGDSALKQTLGKTEMPGFSSSAVDKTEAKTGSSSPSPTAKEDRVGVQESVHCPVEGCPWPSGLPRNKCQTLLHHALDAHNGDLKPLEMAFNLGNRNCSTCYRVCLSFQHYQDHVTIHKDTPRHPCLHRGCGARFKGGREMRLHTRRHAPLQAGCCFPGCTELFICLWALNLHEREHYSNAATTAVKKTSLKVRRKKVKERKVAKGRPGRKLKEVQPLPTGAVKVLHRLEINNKFKRSKMTKGLSGDNISLAGPRITTTKNLSGRYKVRKKMKKTCVIKETFAPTEKEVSSVPSPASDPSTVAQGSGRLDPEVQCVPSEGGSSSVSTTITATTSRVAHRLTKKKAGVSTSKDASSLSNTTPSSSSADNVTRRLKKMQGVKKHHGGKRRGHLRASRAFSASSGKTASMKMTKKPLSKDQGTSSPGDPHSASGQLKKMVLKPLSKDQDTSSPGDPHSASGQLKKMVLKPLSKDQGTSSPGDPHSASGQLKKMVLKPLSKDQDTSPSSDPHSTSGRLKNIIIKPLSPDQDASPSMDPPSTSAEVTQKLKDQDASLSSNLPSSSAEVRQMVKNEVKETETFDELIHQQAIEEKEAPTVTPNSITEVTDEGKKTQVINNEQLVAHDRVTQVAPPNTTASTLTKVLNVTDPAKKKLIKKRTIKDPLKASRKPAKKDPPKGPDPLKPSKNRVKVKSSTDLPSTSGRLKKNILKPFCEGQGTSSSSDIHSTREEATQELKVKNEVNETETHDTFIHQQILEEKEALVEKDATIDLPCSITEATDEGKKMHIINNEQPAAHDGVTAAAPHNTTTKKLTRVAKVTDPVKKKLIVKKCAIKEPFKEPLKASRRPAKNESSKASDPLKPSKKPAKVPVADKQIAKVATKSKSPLSAVKQESKPAVEPSDSTVTSPGYHVVFNGHSVKESLVKSPTGDTLSTGAEQNKPESPSTQESVGRGNKPFIRPPPTAYLDERYTNMPKRRKEMSWLPPCSPKREPQPQFLVDDAATVGIMSPHRQRCIRCFSSFSRPEELEAHMKLKKCATLFGFDSDEEGNG